MLTIWGKRRYLYTWYALRDSFHIIAIILQHYNWFDGPNFTASLMIKAGVNSMGTIVPSSLIIAPYLIKITPSFIWKWEVSPSSTNFCFSDELLGLHAARHFTMVGSKVSDHFSSLFLLYKIFYLTISTGIASLLI